MNSQITISLETDCRLSFPRFNPRTLDRLNEWKQDAILRHSALIEQVISCDVSRWKTLIDHHPANHHPFYNYMATDASGELFSRFLIEESRMPSFVGLLKSLLDADLPIPITKIITDNLRDEYTPKLHALLFNDMLDYVTSHYPARIENDDLLSETNLVFHFGAAFDPLFLIGALCPTEVMVPRRVRLLQQGLTRLKLDQEMTFLDVHATCDERHGDEWFEGVVVPLSKNEDFKRKLAEGLVVRLETSTRYLDSRLRAWGGRKDVAI